MKFSIILPTYNRAGFLPQAIVSVLAQTYCNWELLVIDDGSTDNTREVVNHFISKDVRVKYFYQKNQERSAARNHGIEKSSGEWICFLDSDDYFLENHLTVFRENIAQHARTELMIVAAEKKSSKPFKSFVELIDDGVSPQLAFLISTEITPINVRISHSILKQLKFIEKYKKAYWEDTHLWVRIATLYEVIVIKERTTVLYENETRSVNQKLSLRRIKDHIAMIEDLKLSITPCTVELSDELNKYIVRKYKMFLYTTRQNRQLCLALYVWWKGIIKQPSVYFWTEYPKIFLNKLGIGIHNG